jgi:hypothetical protein
MKTKLISFLVLICTVINTSSAFNFIKQDSLGLPGDNLDLYAVLELFKKSENPGEFEKALNKEDNKINNLDLNSDNEIDYIKVIDHTEKDAHALVLQVDINEKETQDVAVIEIEKKGNEIANLQIIGDEELYGKDYIIEPAEELQTQTPVSSQNKTSATVVVNVWGWPIVPHLYRPSYVVWISPWAWHAYPVWWRPWRPVYWTVYHPYWYPHHAYHHRVYTHTTIVAHNVYYGHRTVSKTVIQKRVPIKQSARPGRKVQGKQPQRVKNQSGNHQQKGVPRQKNNAGKPGKRK